MCADSTNILSKSELSNYHISQLHVHLYFVCYDALYNPVGTLKMRDMNLQDMKMRHHVAGVENARNAIVWNTECCICLSIAEQEYMSRQERHQISPLTVFLGFSV